MFRRFFKGFHEVFVKLVTRLLQGCWEGFKAQGVPGLIAQGIPGSNPGSADHVLVSSAPPKTPHDFATPPSPSHAPHETSDLDSRLASIHVFPISWTAPVQISGPVAQWIRHRPTEPGIAGSSPARVKICRWKH